jgi:hypothetical protein
MSFSRRSSNPAAFASSGSSPRATASPDGFWYDQPQHEWVVVPKGTAKLRFEDETIEMRTGDFTNILAQKKHRGELTDTRREPTISLLAKTAAARLIDLGLGKGQS